MGSFAIIGVFETSPIRARREKWEFGGIQSQDFVMLNISLASYIIVYHKLYFYVRYIYNTEKYYVKGIFDFFFLFFKMGAGVLLLRFFLLDGVENVVIVSLVVILERWNIKKGSRLYKYGAVLN